MRSFVLTSPYGYLVTDGETRVRTFHLSDYQTRRLCLEAALAYAGREDRVLSSEADEIAYYFLTYLLIEV